MTVPNLVPPTAHLSEEEALRRVEELRRQLPKATAKPPAGPQFDVFRRDWWQYLRREA